MVNETKLNHITIKNFVTSVSKSFMMLMIALMIVIVITMTKNLISKSLMMMIIKLMIVTMIAMLKYLILKKSYEDLDGINDSTMKNLIP